MIIGEIAFFVLYQALIPFRAVGELLPVAACLLIAHCYF
jgi:hypothetical protein